MLTRVTPQMLSDQSAAYMQQQSAELADIQTQISSGIKVAKPSDGPNAYAQIQSGKQLDARYDTYLGNINSATSDLNAGVSTLTDVNAILTSAKQVAQQGINGATDSASYETLASQVDTLLNRLVADGNTQVGGRNLFGGTSTQQAPFVVTAQNASGQPTTISYQGSDQSADTLIGPGQSVKTLYSGDQILQQPGADAFQTLINMRDSLRNPALTSQGLSQALTTSLSELQQESNNVENVVGAQSADLQNLQAVQTRIQGMQLNTKSRVSDLESTDYASVVVRLNEVQNIFQATLATSARLYNESFMNFIK